MHDVLALGIVQGVQHGPHRIQGGGKRQEPSGRNYMVPDPADMVCEGVALDQLHGEKKKRVCFSHLVNLNDVGVGKDGGHLGFLNEKRRRFRRENGFGQNLNGDPALEGALKGHEHNGHGAAVQFL